MTLQLFYSKRCPKSREILFDIIGNKTVRPHFVLISIDKHLETKRKMPKGIRQTPTVHRETASKIHVYEGDDIKILINQIKSEGNDLIGPVGPNGPVGSSEFPPRKQIVEDDSWKNAKEGSAMTSSFEISETRPSMNKSPEQLKADRDETDKRIEETLRAQKNDPRNQQFVEGMDVKKN